MIGQTLGRYRVLARIGAGGMGEVYRAHDEQLERDVAVKVLPASQFADPEARRRLLREARAAASLNHPHVCTIHEVGEAEGQVFLAMELIEGQRLDRLIPPGGLHIEAVLRHGLQVADAVAHAHERGIVHRDLKTSNTLVTPEGRVKVLDFGLAKRVRDSALSGADTESVPLTDAGAVVGTVPYMAPEVLSGEPADARSDVWSLGVVLFEMAAGSRPFRGRTGFELSSAILNQTPAALPPGVPLELRLVIERCLEKAPERRYQRAGELHAALQALETGSGRSHGWRPSRGGRRAAALAALVSTTLAIVLTLDVGGARSRWLSRTGASAGAIKLAVMPFQNLTGDPEQEYFSDGLTDDMITQLGRLHPQRLSVIARTSSMRYKNRATPLHEVGRELGVDYVLEGSVRREATHLRINATLIHVRDQTQRWAESYDRELAGVLALQNDVARGVAGALALALLPAEQARLATTRPVDPEAYEAYLKGRFYWQRLGPKNVETAMNYLQLAVGRDPNYAVAYAGIGTLWGMRCFGGATPCREAVPKWKEAARKAKALDPNLAEAQAQIAAIAFYADWDWPAAEREFRRAIELDPGYPDSRMWYAEYLVNVAGRLDEGIAESRRALELDPRNSLYQASLGRTLLAARRADDAVEALQRALKTDPDLQMAKIQLQQAFELKGMYKEAHAVWQQVMSRDRETADAVSRAYAEGGYQRAMRTRGDIQVRRSQTAYVAPGSVAQFYARAGDKELAMDWLEKAFEEREAQLVRLKGPHWDSLRGEPRFEALLRRMKLPN